MAGRSGSTGRNHGNFSAMLGVPLKADTFLPRRFQHIKQPFVAQLRELGCSVFHFGVLDRPRQHFRLRRALL